MNNNQHKTTPPMIKSDYEDEVNADWKSSTFLKMHEPRESQSPIDNELNPNDEIEIKPSNESTKRNCKGTMFALLVISIICALIILACFLTYDSEKKINYGIPLTLNSIISLGSLIQRTNTQLLKENLVYLAENGSIVAINFKTSNSKELIQAKSLQEKQNFTGYFSVSNNMEVVLLRYSYIQVHRRSYLANYEAFILLNGSNERIEIGPFTNTSTQPMLNHAELSPSAETVAFVYRSQLYYIKNLMENWPHLVTHASKNLPQRNFIYGIAGFLYEEEIIGTSQTFWWNPSGSKLAFTGIDESNVSTTNLFFYEAQNLDSKEQFIQHRYPKAGEKNPFNIPIVHLYVNDLSTEENTEFQRPKEVPWDASLSFFVWMNSETFLTGWVNRRWQESWLIVGNCLNNTMHVVFHDKVQFGWINMPNEQYQMPIVEKNTKSILLVAPYYYNKSVFRGIVRINLEIGEQNWRRNNLQWIHTPDYDIKDILYAYDVNQIIYLSSGPDPKEMHVFWTEDGIAALCLTCDDPTCTYSSAKVSKDGSTILQECQGPSPPTTYLKRIVRKHAKEKGISVKLEIIAIVANNSLFKTSLARHAMPVVKFEKITINKGEKMEIAFEVKFIQPPELVESHITKYPLLLHSYGGPISQQVTTKFTLDWFHFLSARLKFIVASIDGRGTTGRGKLFESQIYKNLGAVEINDQLDGLRQITKQFKYVNSSKMCSFGWSYGGFTVANLLGHAKNDILNCGVAVAPVTDFRLYDSAYTEKFLGLYSENANAYLQTHVTKLAKNFKSKDFLIIHGMADDNVNLMHSTLLIKELIRAGVDFHMMFYPDDNHFIAQRGFRLHLWKTVINFIVDSVNQSSFRHLHTLDEI